MKNASDLFAPPLPASRVTKRFATVRSKKKLYVRIALYTTTVRALFLNRSDNDSILCVCLRRSPPGTARESLYTSSNVARV